MWNILVKILFRNVAFPIEQNRVDAKLHGKKLEDLRVELIHELMIVDEKIALQKELANAKKSETPS